LGHSPTVLLFLIDRFAAGLDPVFRHGVAGADRASFPALGLGPGLGP